MFVVIMPSPWTVVFAQLESGLWCLLILLSNSNQISPKLKTIQIRDTYKKVTLDEISHLCGKVDIF